MAERWTSRPEAREKSRVSGISMNTIGFVPFNSSVASSGSTKIWGSIDDTTKQALPQATSEHH